MMLCLRAVWTTTGSGDIGQKDLHHQQQQQLVLYSWHRVGRFPGFTLFTPNCDPALSEAQTDESCPPPPLQSSSSWRSHARCRFILVLFADRWLGFPAAAAAARLFQGWKSCAFCGEAHLRITSVYLHTFGLFVWIEIAILISCHSSVRFFSGCLLTVISFWWIPETVVFDRPKLISVIKLHLLLLLNKF